VSAGVKFKLADHTGAGGIPQPDPSLSLTGKMSTTETQSVESTLTAVSATLPKSVFTDETQETGFGIPPAAPSGDPRSPQGNSGGYDAQANLRHWWRLTFDPLDETGGGDRGIDYGDNPLDFDEIFDQPVDPGEQVSGAPENAPVTMYQQRTSYPLGGQWNGMHRDDEAWDSAGDEMTVAAWVRSTDNVTVGAPRAVFIIKPNIGASGVSDNNFLLLSLGDINGTNDGRLSYYVHDNDYGSNSRRVEYISDTVVSEDAWHLIVARHTLSTQSCDLFIDGVKETSYTTSNFSSGIVRDDPGGDFSLDAGFGSVRTGHWEFVGQAHSIMTWNVALSDAAIAELADFGDGLELPAAPVVDHAGQWLTFHTGDNVNAAVRVAAFDDGTGEFSLDGDLALDAQVADVYRVWPNGGVFSDFDGPESVARSQKSRLLYVDNETGGTLLLYRFWVEALDPGPLVCEIAQGSISGGELVVTGIEAEEDEPSLSTTANFVQGASGIERFGRPPSYPVAEFSSPLNVSQMINNAFAPIFVKLSFHPGAQIPNAHRCVFQINADSDAGTIIGSMLIVVDVNGADELLDLGPDRALRLKAGARVQAIVRDSNTGVSIPNRTITITLDSGPGTLGPQSAEVTGEDLTDPVRATYISPTDEGQVGAAVEFRVEVN
jgi:hypothetical protein